MNVSTMLFYPLKSSKMFPWAALTCLFFAYAVVGMFLADLLKGWLGWALPIAGIFLVTIVFTLPQFKFEQQFSRWLRSDTGAFVLLVVMAALLSVVLLWLHIFLKLFAMLAAEAIIRLELRHSSFSVITSFWLLPVTSLAGVSLGWFVSSFV